MSKIQVHAGSERIGAFRFRKLALGVLRFVAVGFFLTLAVTQVYANVRTFGMWGFIGLVLATPLISFAFLLARIRLTRAPYVQKYKEMFLGPEPWS